jgi:hypothetical protein
MGLEVWEVELADKRARDLHSFDGRDLSTELEELHLCMARLEDECVTEARDLSVLVVVASNALVDLEMLPIRDMPQLPKKARDVLKAAGVIFKWL